MGVWRFAYTGGADTPGPDPKAVVPTVGSEVRSTSASPAASPTRGTSATATPKVTTTDASVSHTYDTARHQDGDADGHLRRRRHGHQDGRTAADVPTPLFTNVNADVGATVPLRAGADARRPATFGTFTPSLDQGLHRVDDGDRARHQRQRAADASSDPAPTTTGPPGQRRLHAAVARCRSRPRAPSAARGGAFADVGGAANPTPLLTYVGAANDAAVTLDFKQHVGADRCAESRAGTARRSRSPSRPPSREPLEPRRSVRAAAALPRCPLRSENFEERVRRVGTEEDVPMLRLRLRHAPWLAALAALTLALPAGASAAPGAIKAIDDAGPGGSATRRHRIR